MEQILIIEDDKDISELLSIHLKDLEFNTDCSYDGKEGLIKGLNNKYKLIVLDIRLPGMDGFEICKQLRMEQINTPIIMLTSKSEEIDKVLGLEIGADDYITKPFALGEFLARVRAALRRKPNPATPNRLEADDLAVPIIKPLSQVYRKRQEVNKI